MYVPSSELGLSHPPSLASECAPSPQAKGGRAHSPAGEGWGSPNSDDWRKSLALFLLCGVDDIMGVGKWETGKKGGRIPGNFKFMLKPKLGGSKWNFLCFDENAEIIWPFFGSCPRRSSRKITIHSVELEQTQKSSITIEKLNFVFIRRKCCVKTVLPRLKRRRIFDKHHFHPQNLRIPCCR